MKKQDKLFLSASSESLELYHMFSQEVNVKVTFQIRDIFLNKSLKVMATWPSGYGAGFRLLKNILPVRKSEGSNPSVVILDFCDFF